MSDIEIIKGLSCLSGNNVYCASCTYADDGRCKEMVAKDALDLIKRQKAVIEELGKRTNIKKVILTFINEKGKMVERTFNVDINCLEGGNHDD